MCRADFWAIVDYGSDWWKGNLTPTEMVECVGNYVADFEISKRKGELVGNMVDLLAILESDGGETCQNWAKRIRREVLGD